MSTDASSPEGSRVEREVRRHVPLTAWQSHDYCRRCGGEWWSAPGGYEIHKRAGRWIATLRGEVIGTDEFLSNCMMRLAA